MMESIAALERDVRLQVPSLAGFHPREPLDLAAQQNSIFCGSGDSLAACMLAEAFSGYAARAADPLDLLKNRSIIRNANLYAVSISGRTISNIMAARLARHSTAVTSNPESRLGRTCDGIIPLSFSNSDIVTAGSISFLESALTCISLVHRFRIRDARHAFELAESLSDEIALNGEIFILGDLYTYPVAMYAAAKLHEILGRSARYERIEQFSHMGLFCAKKGDTVIILEKKTRHNTSLADGLEASGINVILPESGSQNRITQFLFFTFLAQMVPLKEAKKQRRRECHFVTAKALRAASDSMIY